ncbi:hypothetical protein V6N11_044118 [Hibiscus sabdariffa]|uniref:Uncharacterized protein n=1 Tax=Hibiscus sabdariffa TaxID=183260 RepID=A0ABR2REC3_9ROSI
MATQIWSRFRAFGAFVGCNQPKNENEEIEKKHWTTSASITGGGLASQGPCLPGLPSSVARSCSGLAATRPSRSKASSGPSFGEWCDDSAQLRSAATAYFSSLFAVGDSSPVSYPISGYFPTIDEAVSSSLCSIPLD